MTGGPGGRGARGRPHVRRRTAPRRRRSASSRSTATSRCSATSRGTAARCGARSRRSRRSPTAHESTTRSRARSRSSATRSSRPARSSCSPTVRTSAASASLDEAVDAAKGQQVRVFTVGLRSGAFDAGPLRVDRRANRRLVRRGALGCRARGDLRGARHAARGRVPRPLPLRGAPDVAGGRPDRGREASGTATTAYVAPTPSLLAPYHRSSDLDVPALRRLAARAQRSSSGSSCAGSCCSCSRAGRTTTVVDRVESFASASRGVQTGNAASVAVRAASPEPVRARDGGRSSSATSSWRG